MDQIVKSDVDEEQIAPFMQDISRYFEYIDKDDLIKKIVSLEFGKFLAYYADAPSLTPVPSPTGEGSKNSRNKERSKREKGQSFSASAGYRKLFINLGKKDGFYPGELMQFLNKTVVSTNRHGRGHVEVGHIDLLTTISYFEVPEEDAERVIKYVNGQRYKNREVRCNDAEETKPARDTRSPRSTRPTRESRDTRKPRETKSARAPKDVRIYQKEEWMQFLNPNGMKTKGEKSHAGKKAEKSKASKELKGEIPDFSEEGWSIRKPRKKK